MAVGVNDRVYGEDVRLRYATLVNFAARALGLVASLLFLVSVTRRLSVEEFGVWTMIFKYVSYVMPFTTIYNYWLPRTISRGINTAKTGLVLAFSLGVLASLSYTAIAYGVASLFEQPLTPIILAGVMVMLDYVNSGLNAISASHSPQYIGYASLTLRIVQAVLGLLLVAFYRWGLYGAVLSAIGGRAVVLLLMMLLNSKVILRSRIDLNTAREWLKRSWLPLYGGMTTSLMALDALVVRVTTGSEEPVAYYGVAFSLLGLALITRQGLPALYSRLLARGSVEDVLEVAWISYMLTFPIVVGIMVYAEPLAAVYNIKYVVASVAIRIFALASLFQLFSVILSTTAAGIENRDLTVSRSFDLVETLLFKAPTLRYVAIVVYVASLAVASYVFRGNYVLVAAVWGLIYCIREVLFQTLLYRTVKRELNFEVPITPLLKYVARFALAPLGIVAVWILYPVEPQTSIYALLRSLLPAVAFSAAAYFTLLYIIDEKMRYLVRRGASIVFGRGSEV